MTRSWLATTLGVVVAISSVLVLLAGSDLPPPRGFVFVIPVAVVVGILVRVTITYMLAIRETSGLVSALAVAVGVGMAAGFLVGILFVALSPGEPSTPPPSLSQMALLAIVVAVIGGFAAAAVGAIALLADRARTRAAKILTVAVPALVMLLGPAFVVANRFPS